MPHCHTFLARLREAGCRITPQRRQVVSVLAHSGRHMTAEEVHRETSASDHIVNLATVYRTLDLLVELGLASRALLGSGSTVYATGEHGPHVHLVCRLCGKVIEMDASKLEGLFNLVKDSYGFVCGPRHFGLSGVCIDCANTEEKVDSK